MEHFHWIQSLIIKTFIDNWAIKLLVAFGLTTYGFLFDRLLQESMTALLVLIIIDFITGIIAEKKQGHEIKSRKALRSAIKVTLYYLLISAAFLSEVSTQRILLFLDETVIAFLAVTELVSILENIGRSGYAVPQKLLNQLKQYKKEK